MEIKEALRSLLQEMILPEFEQMRSEHAVLGERLNSVDKRLADINMHLVEQSRRIDETNKRIDTVRDELVTMVGETNKRIDRLYEVIVRREEHVVVKADLGNLERRVEELERRVAA
ncbi:MAG: hypothetical protein IMF20_08030 [Proteobacteria bacterium]|nr:hypothetical protein [Pseudomonadota bacterium]